MSNPEDGEEDDESAEANKLTGHDTNLNVRSVRSGHEYDGMTTRNCTSPYERSEDPLFRGIRGDSTVRTQSR